MSSDSDSTSYRKPILGTLTNKVSNTYLPETFVRPENVRYRRRQSEEVLIDLEAIDLCMFELCDAGKHIDPMSDYKSRSDRFEMFSMDLQYIRCLFGSSRTAECLVELLEKKAKIWDLPMNVAKLEMSRQAVVDFARIAELNAEKKKRLRRTVNRAESDNSEEDPDWRPPKRLNNNRKIVTIEL
jgi:hypothetical protein